MFPCIGAPMIGSQPHFYGADPSLLEHFSGGISPNKEEHAIFLHFETVNGLIYFQINCGTNCKKTFVTDKIYKIRIQCPIISNEINVCSIIDNWITIACR